MLELHAEANTLLCAGVIDADTYMENASEVAEFLRNFADGIQHEAKMWTTELPVSVHAETLRAEVPILDDEQTRQMLIVKSNLLNIVASVLIEGHGEDLRSFVRTAIQQRADQANGLAPDLSPEGDPASFYARQGFGL